jgi:MOSC domain-containing protein YiiM
MLALDRHATVTAMNPSPDVPLQVLAVHCGAEHGFSKRPQSAIQMVAGWGVQGDAHGGVTVKHLSRVAKDPTQPNLRQVHLLQAELLDTLRSDGFDVVPGQLGENITTRGIDLLALPQGSHLHIGHVAVLQITGLRNPCVQIDRYKRGLMAAVLGRAADGSLIRKAGVMAIVLATGAVRPGDVVQVVLPEGEHLALQPV